MHLEGTVQFGYRPARHEERRDAEELTRLLRAARGERGRVRLVDGPRDLGHDARAVAGHAVRAAAAAVLVGVERRVRGEEDAARRAGVGLGDEPDAAGVTPARRSTFRGGVAPIDCAALSRRRRGSRPIRAVSCGAAATGPSTDDPRGCDPPHGRSTWRCRDPPSTCPRRHRDSSPRNNHVRPRRRRDPSPRNIYVTPPAASPRPASAEGGPHRRAETRPKSRRRPAVASAAAAPRRCRGLRPFGRVRVLRARGNAAFGAGTRSTFSDRSTSVRS